MLEKYKEIVIIIIFTIITYLIVISIPGYYNHDELGIIYNLKIKSFIGFTFKYFKNTFLQFKNSLFFRPIGYYILVLILQKGNDSPIIPHFVLVLFHSFVGIAFFKLLMQFIEKKNALLTTLIFIISPLAAFSVSWVAALYDILLCFFLIIILINLKEYIYNFRNISLFYVILGNSFALLSKETAIIIPIVVGIWICFLFFKFREGIQELDDKIDILVKIKTRSIVVFIVVLLLSSFYFLLRIQILFNNRDISSGYIVIKNFKIILENLFAYIAYPFYLTKGEITGITKANIIGFLGFSILLFLGVIFLNFIFSKKLTILLISFYIIYLLPVLAINKYETQYLYGCALPFSYLIFSLVSNKKYFVKIYAFALIILLIFHTLCVQKEMYITGLCQTKILSSLNTIEKVVNDNESNKVIKIAPEPGVKWWILKRAIGAEMANVYKNFQFTFNIDEADFILTKDCLAVPKK